MARRTNCEVLNSQPAIRNTTALNERSDLRTELWMDTGFNCTRPRVRSLCSGTHCYVSASCLCHSATGACHSHGSAKSLYTLLQVRVIAMAQPRVSTLQNLGNLLAAHTIILTLLKKNQYKLISRVSWF